MYNTRPYVNPRWVEGGNAELPRRPKDKGTRFTVCITKAGRVYINRMFQSSRYFYVQARNKRSVRRQMNGYHNGTFKRTAKTVTPPTPEAIQITPKNKGNRAIRRTRPAIRKD